MNLIELKTLWSDIKENHRFLRPGTFNYGNIQELPEECSYPVFHVKLLDTVVEENVMVRSYRLSVMDAVNLDKSNLDTVHSATDETLREIVEFLKKESVHYHLVNQPRIVEYENRFRDAVAGNECTVFVRVGNEKSNYCGLPYYVFGIDPNFQTECVTGFNSYSGFSGYSGVSGFSGVNGVIGVDGQSGFSGYSGYSGFSGNDGGPSPDPLFLYYNFS